VSNVTPSNGLVQLYNVNDPANPVALGSTVKASGGMATITLNGNPLADGTYQIAATAAISVGGTPSAFSSSTPITVQTSLQLVSISPSADFLTSLPNNQVVVTFSHPLAGITVDPKTGLASPPFAVTLTPAGPDGLTTLVATGGKSYWSAPSGIDSGDLPVPATLSYVQNPDGTSSIILTAQQPLATDVYVITVSGNLTDLAGNPLMSASGGTGNIFSSFTLRPSPVNLTAPTVTSVTTQGGSVPITSGALIPQPDTIAVAFSKPMDTYTINSTSIQLLANTGPNKTFVPVTPVSVVYSPSTQSAYLTPETALKLGTTYEVQVGTGVTDDQGFPKPGVPLAAAVTRTFTVASPGVNGSSPLVITATNPPDGTLRTQPLGYVSITFSEALNMSSFQRFSAMLIPKTGGVTTNGSDYSDVPFNAKLAFNPNTNQLIIVPTGQLPTAGVTELISLSLSQIKAANGDSLTDTHNKPGQRTFELLVSSNAAVPSVAVASPSTSQSRGAVTHVAVASPSRPVRPRQAAGVLPQGPIRFWNP
jgi:hypothetical protein